MRTILGSPQTHRLDWLPPAVPAKSPAREAITTSRSALHASGGRPGSRAAPDRDLRGDRQRKPCCETWCASRAAAGLRPGPWPRQTANPNRVVSAHPGVPRLPSIKERLHLVGEELDGLERLC